MFLVLPKCFLIVLGGIAQFPPLGCWPDESGSFRFVAVTFGVIFGFIQTSCRIFSTFFSWKLIKFKFRFRFSIPSGVLIMAGHTSRFEPIFERPHLQLSTNLLTT